MSIDDPRRIVGTLVEGNVINTVSILGIATSRCNMRIGVKCSSGIYDQGFESSQGHGDGLAGYFRGSGQETLWSEDGERIQGE